MAAVASRSLLRSAAASGRVSAAKLFSGVKTRASASSFRISSTKSRLLRSNPVEMGRIGAISLLPYHNATASALLNSMLSVAPQGAAWNIEDSVDDL